MKHNVSEAPANTPALAKAEDKQHEGADATAQAAATVSEPDLDEYLLRDLAQRRVATKRNLAGQAFDFLLIVIFSLIMASFSYTSDAYIIAFLFCAFWGLRLAIRVYRFMRPSLMEGIAEYLRRRKEQQLEFEYGRLKRMSAENVAKELSR
ncbi:MAG: hypothetical protein FWG06_00340 [Clostridiales bacterium]|nr:hypothetical protein [Clostridiales bacterium]